MPVQKGKSVLAGVAGLNKLVSKHKADETVLPGGGRLPDGIEGGVAQLEDCRFGVFKDGPNKGKPSAGLWHLVESATGKSVSESNREAYWLKEIEKLQAYIPRSWRRGPFPVAIRRLSRNGQKIYETLRPTLGADKAYIEATK